MTFHTYQPDMKINYIHTIFSAGIQSTSLLPTVSVTVTNTFLQLTPTQSMLPGRENEQDGTYNNITNSVFIAAVTMGTLNIFFLHKDILTVGMCFSVSLKLRWMIVAIQVVPRITQPW